MQSTRIFIITVKCAYSHVTKIGRHKSSNLIKRAEIAKAKRQILENISNNQQPQSKNRSAITDIMSKSLGTSTTNARIEVLLNGSLGYGRTFFLKTDETIYLFNCSEGALRAMYSSHVTNFQLRKVHHVFFTKNSWFNCAGLNCLLTALDSVCTHCIDHNGKERCDKCLRDYFTVHGYEDVMSIIATVRPYTEQQMLLTPAVRCPTAHSGFEDKTIKVKYIPLEPSETEDDQSTISTDIESQEPPPETCNDIGKDGMEFKDTVKKMLNEFENDSSLSSRSKNPSEKKITSQKCKLQKAVAFDIQIRPKLGKVNIEKCKELKIPFGPLIGKLQNGQIITLSDGRVIKPEQVVMAALPPERFLVVDCPDLQHVKLLSEKISVKPNHYHLIVHTSDEAIIQSDAYQNWMKQFAGSRTDHLYINDGDVETPHYFGDRMLASMLNYTLPQFYPKLPNADFSLSDLPELPDIQNGLGCSMHGEPLLRYYLRPNEKRFERGLTEIDLPTQDSIHTEIEELYSFDELTEMTKDVAAPNLDCAKYPRITMLGTSSAVPSTYRGQSNIIVEVDPETVIIMDCGAGSNAQMYTHFGKAQAIQLLLNTRMIFVSHLHQDHYLGIFTLLLERKYLLRKTGAHANHLYIVGTPILFKLLNIFRTLLEPLCDHDELRMVSLHRSKDKVVEPNQRKHMLPILNKCIDAIKCEYLNEVRVNHAMMPRAAIFKTLSSETTLPRTIVYSGDCLPSDELAREAQNADLLIHEATHDSTLEKIALKSRHSTTSQAIDVGRKMGAKHVLLTHFSARYPKLTLIDNNHEPALTNATNVGLANDHMTVSPQNWDNLAATHRVLPFLFPDHHTANIDSVLRTASQIKPQESTDEPQQKRQKT